MVSYSNTQPQALATNAHDNPTHNCKTGDIIGVVNSGATIAFAFSNSENTLVGSNVDLGFKVTNINSSTCVIYDWGNWSLLVDSPENYLNI